MGNMVLTKEMIVEAHDLKEERVVVPEWGGEVRLRELTGAAREEYGYLISSQKVGEEVDPRGIVCHLLALSIVDEAGELVFGLEDKDLLQEKSATVLNRLFDAALKLSGLDTDSVEEARKN